jgi:hypothetical protein
VDEVISELHKILREYQKDTRRCPSKDTDLSFKCDAMVLGALTKGLMHLGVLTRPEPPYEGLSVKNLDHELQNLKIPTGCGGLGGHKEHPNTKGQCGIVKDRIIQFMRGLRQRYPGLDMKELKR